MANQSIFAAFERMWQHTTSAIKNCAPANGVAYVYEEDVDTDVVPLNADTLGGNPPEYYAPKNRVDSLESSLLNLVYPIGSIYLSVSSTDPTSLFGGTWTQLEDRFLLGAGSSYTAGNIGGEASHKLTISEIPAHTHDLYSRGVYSGSGNYIAHCNEANGSDAYSYITGSRGGGGAHNNMPPYLVVYMWKRTA